MRMLVMGLAAVGLTAGLEGVATAYYEVAPPPPPLTPIQVQQSRYGFHPCITRFCSSFTPVRRPSKGGCGSACGECGTGCADCGSTGGQCKHGKCCGGGHKVVPVKVTPPVPYYGIGNPNAAPGDPDYGQRGTLVFPNHPFARSPRDYFMEE